jgi:NodT family efflux transporter outer membrane factor (OMF) lipoprotein
VSANRAAKLSASWSAAVLVASLAACTVGPDYRRPAVDSPAAWRIDPEYSYWHPVAPAHAPLEPDWWKSFGIAELDGLEHDALARNQTLRAAAAHYDQARATLASVTSQRSPEIDLSANVARERSSANRPRLNYATPTFSTVQNDIRVGPSVTYEADLFGRIRREIESAGAAAQQAADDLANARLVLSAELASDYFALRELDAETDVLDRSIVLQQKALDFVTAQHDLGAVSGLNLLQQRTQLDATRTQARLLLNQRAQYEHAIAALIGVPAPQFTLAPKLEPLAAPALPLGVPSELLQRRPDVSSAERAMAAANAQIGVARAAYFPSLTLSPTLGWESTRFASLASVPSLVWTVGGSVGETLFDGGRRAAGVAYARAGYAAAEANYRQTVLTAFEEVQNGVTGLAVLDAALRDAHAAVTDAQRLLDLANDRYAGGLVAYLDVITAQQQLLTNERQEVQIRGQRASLVVYLAKALGGGWDATQPPPALQESQR